MAGRKPFGIENIFRILSGGVAKSLNGGLQRPIDFLRENAKLGKVTIRKYLTQLSDGGYVQLTFGGHRNKEIVYIKLLKSDFSSGNGLEIITPAPQQEAPAEKPSGKPISAPVVSQPAAAPISTISQSLVAVLVDFDNTEMTASDNGFSVSFSKLLDYLRKFGQVMFADVFLSSFSTSPKNISQLWEAGFTPIACPQPHKQKDAVDEKMKDRARDYLREMNIGKIVVVSRDRDFQGLKHYAANLHKETIFVNIAAIQEAVRGRDIVPEIVPTRSEERFRKIIDCLASGVPVMAAQEEGKKFIKDIILAILRRESNSSGLDSFNPLCDYVKTELQHNWRRIFSSEDYKDAMTALHQRGVLTKNEVHRMTYYRLYRKHPAVEAILGAKNLVKSSK